MCLPSDHYHTIRRKEHNVGSLIFMYFSYVFLGRFFCYIKINHYICKIRKWYNQSQKMGKYINFYI